MGLGKKKIDSHYEPCFLWVMQEEIRSFDDGVLLTATYSTVPGDASSGVNSARQTLPKNPQPISCKTFSRSLEITARLGPPGVNGGVAPCCPSTAWASKTDLGEYSGFSCSGTGGALPPLPPAFVVWYVTTSMSAEVSEFHFFQLK